MSFYRRHRNRAHPPRGVMVGTTVSGEGTAILCFPPDGTFFRGLVTTSTLEQAAQDDSPYALYGRETPTIPGQYKVTVADLETGAQHHLTSVQLRGELRKMPDNANTASHRPDQQQCSAPGSSSSSAIPILQNPRIISMQNSPNFDNIFLNESCPTFHHQFNTDGLPVAEEEENAPSLACETFEENICSSFSDIAELEPPPVAKYLNSLSTTSSSRGSSLSPATDNKSTQSPQFSLESEDEDNMLQFTADSVFRGQKADMMIQQFMAGSKLVGSKCVVLVGPLRFCVADTPLLNNKMMAWSL